jgi:hypothetical protein
MEFVALVLCFVVVLLKLIDEVTHPVHFHPLHALSCEVHYESYDLRGTVISDDLASYKLKNEAHYAILDKGYLVASLTLFYIAIILIYALCKGAI